MYLKNTCYNHIKMFTLVNKNLLIPDVLNIHDEHIATSKLYDYTYNKDTNYCNNCYVVYNNGIFFCKNNVIYNIDNNKNVTRVTCQNELLNVIYNYNEIDVSEMDITYVINEKKNVNIIEDEKVEPVPEPEQKSDKELELEMLCKQTLELYEAELQKIKNIEHRLKILDNNEKNLIKKLNDKIYCNISMLKNDYNLYKILSGSNKEIPSLFSKKFRYFEEIIKDNEMYVTLSEIEKLDLDSLLNNDMLKLSNELINLSNNYKNIIKELTVDFEHSWEDLNIENDFNNNSLFN